jgi:hypothetical protein
MANGARPAAGRSVADIRLASAWLARHGLTDVQPTPVLATRLAARRRLRLADGILLAWFVTAAVLTLAFDRLNAPTLGGSGDDRWASLSVLAAVVVAVVLVRWLLERWVRRADRRAGAGLPRRVAHPVRLGWRAVIGAPFAAVTVAMFAAAAALAVGALTAPDATVRYAALIVLMGLFGVAAGTAVQVRHLLTRPMVAADEHSLMADVVMRVEDARTLATPTAVWSMPIALLFGTALGWWNAAALVGVVLGALALGLLKRRAQSVATMARHAVDAR